MEVHWKSEKLRKTLEDFNYLKAQYDEKVAQNVAKRLREIGSFENYAELPPNTGKHSIKDGKKLRYFAVDLPSRGAGRGKWRLAFKPYGEYDPANQKTITSVVILGVENYHK
ncbi:hypothetical protein KJ835_01500 [Patescibacteria group bacterium]|nr:hypothetical protein [Patescibacteria group bacterium]